MFSLFQEKSKNSVDFLRRENESLQRKLNITEQQRDEVHKDIECQEDYCSHFILSLLFLELSAIISRKSSRMYGIMADFEYFLYQVVSVKAREYCKLCSY